MTANGIPGDDIPYMDEPGPSRSRRISGEKRVTMDDSVIIKDENVEPKARDKRLIRLRRKRSSGSQYSESGSFEGSSSIYSETGTCIYISF